MKTKDVTQTLKTLGWSTHRDECGDRYALYRLADRIVHIIYGVKHFATPHVFYMSESISTDRFSETCFRIRARGPHFAHLTPPSNGWKIQVHRVTKQHVQRGSEEIIAWAKAQDINAALQDKAALPTTVWGSGPVLHLGALAVLGNIEKLKSYQTSFAAGDRLGFALYITKDYIDRAVEIAERSLDS